MNFLSVIETVCSELDESEVGYALIGGFAMALRGVQRATIDLDFIMLMNDVSRCDMILTRHGYRRAFNNDNVSHYISDDAEWGRIDILHAFRTPSLGMLERAERIDLTPSISIPVVQIEDIIGLKIQALVNDPSRAVGDWNDIRLLISAASRNAQPLDWELISDYLGIFDLQNKHSEIRTWYGEANS